MKRFKNILLVTGGESWQQTALQRGLALALHNQADLTLVHALRLPAEMPLSGDPAYDQVRNGLMDACREELGGIVADLPETIRVSTRVLEGSVFPDVVREVLRQGHDLVIKCAETTKGFRERIFGSTDMHLLRKCPCPVWIMKDREKRAYQCIVAAVDTEHGGQDGQTTGLNRQILEIASSLALSEFAELHIVHAWQVWGEGLLNTPRFNFSKNGEVEQWVQNQKKAEEDKVASLGRELEAILGAETMEYLQPAMHNIKGEPQEVIPDYVRESGADLVVMGTVARTGIPGFIMGNTAESILSSIECSVLAVKPRGFVSPVTAAEG